MRTDNTRLGSEQDRPANTTKLRWKCPTEGSPWVDKPDIAPLDKTPVSTAPRALMLVNSKRRAQIIDGWGGCFNERG